MLVEAELWLSCSRLFPLYGERIAVKGVDALSSVCSFLAGGDGSAHAAQPVKVRSQAGPECVMRQVI
jgi:hypothetical protein